ncbi:hypothetical protein [Aquibacillus kalidii]|uniref:hypothetical protein n=1 Tax=Aquibacillus kalidii TaxID=2762597 RepID=UPI001C9A0361|nr:hypothetical protein [Aquibacillus kalidii]
MKKSKRSKGLARYLKIVKAIEPIHFFKKVDGFLEEVCVSSYIVCQSIVIIAMPRFIRLTESYNIMETCLAKR